MRGKKKFLEKIGTVKRNLVKKIFARIERNLKKSEDE